MRVGTKSLLFGIHQFILHPLLLALAWNRLYGFPLNPKLWLCFIVHDIGYFGKINMDGPEGESHPELGAAIISRLFGPKWGAFCLYHSRFYSKSHNTQISKLCVADKLAFCMYPPKLYCFLATLTGEIHLYKRFCQDLKYFDVVNMSDLEWYHALKRITLRVVVHSDRTYCNHVEIGKERRCSNGSSGCSSQCRRPRSLQ